MKEKSGTRSLIGMSPARLAVVLTVIAAMLVPAAVAWACNPQGDVRTDQQSYRPGEDMTVSGSWFSSNTNITITTDPPGVSAGTTSTSAGTFRTTVAAPSEPGSYALMASDGRAPARTTFTVAERTQPSGGTPTFGEPTIDRSPAGVVTRVGQPTGSSGGSDPGPRPQPARAGSSEPTTIVLRPAPAPAARTTGGGGSLGGGGGFDGGGGSSGGGSGGGESGAGGAASGTESGVIRVPAGRSVFVDSLAPADRRAGGAGRATTTAAGRGPSERAATGDLWGGFRSGKAPSLLDAGGSADDSGPGASIGLALLGLGLVGLLSALAVAEARRRRALAG